MVDFNFITLNDRLAAQGTIAAGINDSGTIVGTYYDSSNNSHGFVYSDGAFITFDSSLGTGTIINGINNSGQMVGGYLYPLGPHGAQGVNPFFYTNSHFISINPDPSFGFLVRANGINNAGQIVGSDFYQSFLYNGGTATTIQSPSGIFLDARGINSAGQIVGSYQASTATDSHGFLDSGGTFTIFDDPLGTHGTTATGINDAGQIVGTYEDSSFNSHGFFYNNGIFTTVRRQMICERLRRDLVEAAAHLVVDLKRLSFGAASGGSGLFFV